MTTELNGLLLQTTQPGGAPWVTPTIMVCMFVVMYFFMILPQQKRAKEQKKFAESMNAGEYVITTGGIHGTIQRVNDDGTLQVETGRGNFMKIERSAVSMEMTAAYRKKQDVAAGIAVATK
jgi:preprotein translocase subunit YajC